MKNALIPVKSPADFRFASLIPTANNLTPTQKAASELILCFDDMLQKTPLEFRDFLLRAFSSFGIPIDYPKLPFWLERPARHIFTLCLPTLRNDKWSEPSPEMLGKYCGHMAAIIAHAKEGTAIFQRLPKESADELRSFFLKIEMPVRVLLSEGANLPPKEAEAFLRGLDHAYKRTFDLTGLPRGWNTNSPVLLGLCMSWRYIVTQSPTLSALRNIFAKQFGEQEIGSDDRVKKICHRIGLRFAGNRATDSQGTSVILDVPTDL
jgi:hypothetical protein